MKSKEFITISKRRNSDGTEESAVVGWWWCVNLLTSVRCWRSLAVKSHFPFLPTLGQEILPKYSSSTFSRSCQDLTACHEITLGKSRRRWKYVAPPPLTPYLIRS